MYFGKQMNKKKKSNIIQFPIKHQKKDIDLLKHHDEMTWYLLTCLGAIFIVGWLFLILEMIYLKYR